MRDGESCALGATPANVARPAVTDGGYGERCIEAAGDTTRMILTTHFDSLAGMGQAIDMGVAEGMNA